MSLYDDARDSRSRRTLAAGQREWDNLTPPDPEESEEEEDDIEAEEEGEE